MLSKRKIISLGRVFYGNPLLSGQSKDPSNSVGAVLWIKIQ